MRKMSKKQVKQMFAADVRQVRQELSLLQGKRADKRVTLKEEKSHGGSPHRPNRTR